jgi:hypothetical protein
MYRLLLLSMASLIAVLCGTALAYNPCADLNSNGTVDIVDIVIMATEHMSSWGGFPALAPGQGDIDYRAGYNEGDAHYLIDFIFRGGFEGSCPPFPSYTPVSTNDVLRMPKVLFGPGSGSLALPIIWSHQGWISDFLLPISIRGLGPNVVADSLARGACFYESSPFGAIRRSWPLAYVFWSHVDGGAQLTPGVDTVATLYIHYSSAFGESLAVDAAQIGPHTFLNYVTGPSAAENYADMVVGIPHVTSHWTLPTYSAIMRPDPQYVYYLYALNPITDTVYFGFFPEGYTAADVNLATVQIGTIAPTSVSVQPASHGFTGDVIMATFPLSEFIAPLGAIYDETPHVFTVAWEYSDGSPASMDGVVLVIGKSSQNPSQFLAPPDIVVLPGDINFDAQVDISDAVAMIGIIFGGGPMPENPLNGDADCSSTLDISDVVYLVQYIFSSGPAPCLLP